MKITSSSDFEDYTRKMFKVLAISALFFILVADAAKSCKSETTISVDGACPSGQSAVGEGYNCCDNADVYEMEAFECSGESVGPALFGICPDGFLAVAGWDCCAANEVVPKKK